MYHCSGCRRGNPPRHSTCRHPVVWEGPWVGSAYGTPTPGSACHPHCNAPQTTGCADGPLPPPPQTVPESRRGRAAVAVLGKGRVVPSPLLDRQPHEPAEQQVVRELLGRDRIPAFIRIDRSKQLVGFRERFMQPNPQGPQRAILRGRTFPVAPS